jgi:hypothetical protein
MAKNPKRRRCPVPFVQKRLPPLQNHLRVLVEVLVGKVPEMGTFWLRFSFFELSNQ